MGAPNCFTGAPSCSRPAGGTGGAFEKASNQGVLGGTAGFYSDSSDDGDSDEDSDSVGGLYKL